MAAKDYEKYEKPQSGKSDDKKRAYAYDIKNRFRGATDGTTFMNVPLHKLVDFREDTPFSDYIDTEKFESLVRDIQENGIITPLILRELPDHTYEVLAGRHRSRAAKVLRLATVPANVHPISMTDEQAMIIHINTNVLNGREGLSFYETVRAMAVYDSTLEKQRGKRSDLEENKGEKFDRYQQLADVFKIGNRTTALQYVKAGLEMPEDIIRKVDIKFVPFSVAYKIMCLEDEHFRNDLYDYIRKGNKLSMKTLDSLIAAYEDRNKNAEESHAEVQSAAVEEISSEPDEGAFAGFETLDEEEFDVLSDQTEPESASVVSTPQAEEPKAKERKEKKLEKAPVLNIKEFDNIVNDAKKKKVLTVKIDKTSLPPRFINLDEDQKEDLIVALIKEWDGKFENY